MSKIAMITDIEAPLRRCFDVSRDIDVHARALRFSNEVAVAGVTSGLIGLGECVTWRAKHFARTWTMTSCITRFESPTCFVDEMESGPFARYIHEHYFESVGAVTRMSDRIDYELPLGALGAIADVFVVRRYLGKLITLRNQVIKEIAEES